jgi:hypothetical protein
MKTSTVIAALAMAFAGSSFAAVDLPNVPANDNMQQANPKAAKNFKDLAQKTKRGAHMAAAKTRNLMHGNTKQAATSTHTTATNTSAMGAPSDSASARQRRMDEAYAHWQAGQRK